MSITWTPGLTLDAIEEQIIKKAIIHYNGNKTATAQALGVSIRTIENKLERYAEEEREQGLKDAERKRQADEFLARSRGQYEHPSNAWVSSQPILEDTTEQTLPMSESEGIPGMLPVQVTSLRAKGRSR